MKFFGPEEKEVFWKVKIRKRKKPLAVLLTFEAVTKAATKAVSSSLQNLLTSPEFLAASRSFPWGGIKEKKGSKTT